MLCVIYFQYKSVSVWKFIFCKWIHIHVTLRFGHVDNGIIVMNSEN